MKKLAFLLFLFSFSCNQIKEEFESSDQQWMREKQILKKILSDNHLVFNNSAIVYDEDNFAHLDTFQIGNKIFKLQIRKERPSILDSNYIQLNTDGNKINYTVFDSKNKSEIKTGSINIKDFPLSSLDLYPTAYLYLYPLRSNIDILKRVLYDVELNFWIKSATNKYLKIRALNNFLNQDTSINYFHLTKRNDPLKKEDLTLNVSLQNKKLLLTIKHDSLNVIAKFFFVKQQKGYYLEKKEIQIK